MAKWVVFAGLVQLLALGTAHATPCSDDRPTERPGRIAVQSGDRCQDVLYGELHSGRPGGGTIIFLHGDVPHTLATPNGSAQLINAIAARARRSAPEHRIILLVRPGFFGSDGDRAHRFSPATVALLAGAIDGLQRRAPEDAVAIVGHSGGATNTVAALAFMTSRPNCIVAASGIYAWRDVVEVVTHRVPKGRPRSPTFYDIEDRIASIAPDANRSLLFLADPADRVAPYLSSKRVAHAFRALGHRSAFSEGYAADPDHHDLMDRALQEAAQCLAERLRRLGR